MTPSAPPPRAEPDPGHRPPADHADPPRAGSDPDDPWDCIPAELLDQPRPYDTDSAGGCG